jgi:methylated-DNA-[protein]-cysteine S-methyltransferase
MKLREGRKPMRNRVGFDDDAVAELVRTAHERIERALAKERRPEARVATVRSPIGRLLVAETERGIVAVNFLAVSDADATLDALRRRFDLAHNEPATRRMESELGRYFAGDVRALRRPIDLSLVEGEFQRRALERLRSVPPGAVITYRGLAAALGEPSGQRAVGNSMARNPVPLYVPCHRVIRSDGTVGNYGGGVERKLRLLRLEGFRVGADQEVPPDAVFGHMTTRIFCRRGCRAVKRAEPGRFLIFAGGAHARAAGMRACQICRPA